MSVSAPENLLETATIEWDGDAREAGPNGEPIETYVVKTSQGPFWFEAYYDYAENQTDFRVTVRNFGLRRKASAGSTTPLVRRPFDAAEAATAKIRLDALFLGPYDNPALPFIPFRRGRSKCLGVNFPDGWITSN